MSESRRQAKVEFGGAATYRIVVQGSVTAYWRDRLAGLSVSTTSESGEEPRTTLVGAIRDPAELNGVLDTLYGLHLTLIKVEKVES